MLHSRARLVSFGWCLVAATVTAPVTWGQPPKEEDLSSLLEAVREKHQVPGLAAAVVRDGSVVAAGAAGVREVGKPDRLTADDRMLIGSCGKSMTAMLIAVQVDRGKLAWDTPLADALPDFRLRPEYRPATVSQLLRFRAGLPAYTVPKGDEPGILAARGDTPQACRRNFLAAVLEEPPAALPGTKEVYSNAAFAAAGAVIDRLAGRPWEEAVAAELWKPLGLTTAVVGEPRVAGPDQPACHEKRGDAFVPVGMDRSGFRSAIAPAGHISCSIRDFARYAAAHLKGFRGEGPILSRSSYDFLHTPGGGAAEGMTPGGMLQRNHDGGREWFAFGTAGASVAAFRIFPDQNVAIVVATNGNSFPAVNETTAALKARFGVRD